MEAVRSLRICENPRRRRAVRVSREGESDGSVVRSVKAKRSGRRRREGRLARKGVLGGTRIRLAVREDDALVVERSAVVGEENAFGAADDAKGERLGVYLLALGRVERIAAR